MKKPLKGDRIGFYSLSPVRKSIQASIKNKANG
jgi:hypothetical protein